MHYSVLDLAPVAEGSGPEHAIENSVDLARHAEEWGYHRFWMAEHHNMPGIASSATAVLLGHVANATRHIRVGAGGIMLPNHAPLAVAEQFGTLATIYPDRIDLGLGRAPGGDMAVARALRRSGGDDFPSDVMALQTYLGPPRSGAAVRALPGEGTRVPLYILGSSLYGAQLAAHLGLPYAFASHFAPDALKQALATYRGNFRPSDQAQRPHVILAVNVFAAETRAQAQYIRTSMQQSFARLRFGTPGKLPAPVKDIDAEIGSDVRQGVDHALRVTATGTRNDVRDRLGELIDQYDPDEIILTGMIHDHAARLRSFEIAADAMSDIGADRTAA